MARSTLAKARPAIAKFFDKAEAPVFRRGDLSGILRECRHAWELAKAVNVDDLITHLIDNSHLKEHVFNFPSRTERLYSWRSVSLLHLLHHLKPKGYFTHLTAARLNGLSPFSRGEIYLNIEQKPHVRNPASLTQEGINNAFRNYPRVSNNFAMHGESRIVLLNGMHTNALGVEGITAKFEKIIINVRATNLERTLIDLAVRPVYSGGVHNVLTCYRNAKGKVRVSHMASMIKSLDYVYPYHQAIGFYLQKSGYSAEDVEVFRALPMNFDFYLDHRIKNPRYIREWRLHVPAEMA